MKKSKVLPWLGIVLAVVFLAIAIEILAQVFVHDRPEQKACRGFLEHSTAVAAYFGKIESLRYLKSGSGRGVTSTEKSWGKSRFRIRGTKAKETVRVEWRDFPESGGFSVQRVFLERPWQGSDSLLWSAANP